MGKRGIRDILSETQDSISCIEEDTREQVEALMERYEKDKKRRMKVGNQALQSAVITDLAPKHERLEFAVKEIETDPLCVDLSFLRFALGVTKSVRYELGELMKKLTQGIGEADLAWYNDPNNSRSKYYSVPTIDERLREEEEGDFPDRYGYSRTVPILYLGKEFEELNFERPGEWNEDEES